MSDRTWRTSLLGKLCALCLCAHQFGVSRSKCPSSAVQLKTAAQASDYGILRSNRQRETGPKVVNDSGVIQAMAEVSSGRVFAGNKRRPTRSTNAAGAIAIRG